jgi:hypothetical protein
LGYKREAVFLANMGFKTGICNSAISTALAIQHQIQGRDAYRYHVLLWRPYRLVETPVPIPNTVVKHLGPMIVRVLAKVGIAIFINPLPGHLGKGFFVGCVN